MAHTVCPNGHGMWDGDFKPVVYVFRLGFLREFIKNHPKCKLERKSGYEELYDCVDGVIGEDLDCWYCDECKGLVVFVDNFRYDFKRMESLPDKSEDFHDWEEYIALRNKEFEEFQIFYEGKTVSEAIKQYDFEYFYKVSPDKKTIYAVDKEGQVAFGYYQSNFIEW